MAKNKRVLKFTPDEVRKMRRMHKDGESYTAIATEIGCYREEVSNIVLGRSYNWVQDEPPAEGTAAWRRENENIYYGHDEEMLNNPEHQEAIINHVQEHSKKPAREARRIQPASTHRRRNFPPDFVRGLRVWYERFVAARDAGEDMSQWKTLSGWAQETGSAYRTIAMIVDRQTYTWVGDLKPPINSARALWEEAKAAGKRASELPAVQIGKAETEELRALFAKGWTKPQLAQRYGLEHEHVASITDATAQDDGLRKAFSIVGGDIDKFLKE